MLVSHRISWRALFRLLLAPSPRSRRQFGAGKFCRELTESAEPYVACVCSLEDSEWIRAACLNYLPRRFLRFYPEHVVLVKQLQQLAAILGGQLEIPRLPWKYSWMQKVFGWKVAKRAREYYNRYKWAALRFWDKNLFHVGGSNRQIGPVR